MFLFHDYSCIICLKPLVPKHERYWNDNRQLLWYELNNLILKTCTSNNKFLKWTFIKKNKNFINIAQWLCQDEFCATHSSSWNKIFFFLIKYITSRFQIAIYVKTIIKGQTVANFIGKTYKGFNTSINWRENTIYSCQRLEKKYLSLNT